MHVALFVTSFLFVTVFSYSTSFCYDLLGGDSTIFQVVGKYWYEGYLPYVDLFENKGPLIFFINMIGYAIYPRSGVMVLQIIFLYVSCLFIWQAMSLYSSNVRWKILFLLLALIFYAAHYEEGNHVEEYSTMFLSVATYCFLRSLKENKFPPLYGFVYGLGFGACVMIRTSDAASICCQIFLVTIFLLQARDFKNLWKNFLSFVAGFAVIVLPFVIYFAAHGALYDMFYGTILFNMKYTAGPVVIYPFVFNHRELLIIYYIVHFLLFFAMTIVAALAIKDNPRSRLLWSGIFISIMMLILLMKLLRPLMHYDMIILASSPILFAVLHESSDMIRNILNPQKKLVLKRILIRALVIVTVFNFCVQMFYLKSLMFNEITILLHIFSFQYPKQFEFFNTDERENVLKLKALIPDTEKNSFACWGNFCTGAHWILQTGIKSRERFFTNISELSKMDPAVRQEWFGNVRNDPPLWILYGTAPDRKPGEPPKILEEDSELEQLLAEKYLFKGEAYIWPQMMKLYRLKE